MAKKNILSKISDALDAREQLRKDSKKLEKALEKAKAEDSSKGGGK